MNQSTRHRINLSRMWQTVGEASASTMPSPKGFDWNDAIQFTRPSALIRKFNSPTNLDQTSRLFLVFDEADQRLACHFNDIKLEPTPDSTAQSQRFEVTQHIRQTNQIRIELSESSESREFDSASSSVEAIPASTTCQRMVPPPRNDNANSLERRNRKSNRHSISPVVYLEIRNEDER